MQRARSFWPLLVPLVLSITSCKGGGSSTPSLRASTTGTWSVTQRVTSVSGPCNANVGDTETSTLPFVQTGNTLVVDPGADQATGTISGVSVRLVSDTTENGVRSVLSVNVTFNPDATTLTGNGTLVVTETGQPTCTIGFTVTGSRQSSGLPGTQSFFSGLSSNGVPGAFQSGSLPSVGTGPTPTATGPASVLNGGTSIVTVSGSAAFDAIAIGVEGATGYFLLQFAAALTSADVVIELGNAIPSTNFQCVYQIRANGQFGPRTSAPIEVVPAGTGALQVSLSWNSDSDVDLYLVEPGGFTIYYGQPMSPNGGELDVDGNAGCNGSGTNENITYASNPPSGEYTARVNLWDECSGAATTWVLRRNVNGVTQLVSNGSYPAGTPGNGAGEEGGVVVQTFSL